MKPPVHHSRLCLSAPEWYFGDWTKPSYKTTTLVDLWYLPWMTDALRTFDSQWPPFRLSCARTEARVHAHGEDADFVTWLRIRGVDTVLHKFSLSHSLPDPVRREATGAYLRIDIPLVGKHELGAHLRRPGVLGFKISKHNFLPRCAPESEEALASVGVTLRLTAPDNSGRASGT